MNDRFNESSLTRRGFALVEFALPSGGTHKQRVAYSGVYTGASPLIVAGRRAAKRRGIEVANVIRITSRKALIFTFEDTGSRLR